MVSFDLVVIGFGKAGKTLAARMAEKGKRVALIERSPQMYGGTCINIGCIPTKTLLLAAEKGWPFEQAMAEKDAVTTRLNRKNHDGLVSSVTLYDGVASFVDNKTIVVRKDDAEEQLTAETIVINTGAVSNWVPIEGLRTTAGVHDSTGIQQLPRQPERLGIIGAGPIGLEFASFYARLGTHVTVLDVGDRLLPNEEPVAAELARQYLEEAGVRFRFGASIRRVYNEGDAVAIETADGTLVVDALLSATGRKPNIEDLNLGATDIRLTERGAIQVDERCETSVPGVYAVGDVTGAPQFTYLSLDDFRIVHSALTGGEPYTRKDRKAVPACTFIDPPLARIGITEAQAKEAGLPHAVKELRVATMPRAHVAGDLRGVFKAVVNTETQQILGVTLMGEAAHELINLVTMAMDNQLPYTYFQKQIFSHPTMAENFNDLFAV